MDLIGRAGQRRRAVAERLRGNPAAAGVAAVCAAAAIGGAALWTVVVERGIGETPTVREAATVFSTPGGATSIAAGDGTIWTAGFSGREVRPFSPATLEPTGPARTVGARGDVAPHVAAAQGAAWVALQRDGSGLVVRIEPDGSRRVLSTGDLLPDRVVVLPARVVVVGDSRIAAVPIGRGRGWSRPLPGSVDADAGYGSVWAVSRVGAARSLVTRRDPATGKVVGRREAPAAATAIAVGLGAVWVANGCDDGVLRAPVGPGPATCIRVGRGPADVAVGGGAAWAADAAGGRVVQLDPGTGAVVRSWTVPGRPSSVSATGEAVVAITRGGTAVRLERGDARPAPPGPGEQN